MKTSPWIFGISAIAQYEGLLTIDRGTRFTLSRDELLTLPEFVLLSLFPNGLFPEGHMGGFAEGDAVQVDVRSDDDATITSATPAPLASLNLPQLGDPEDTGARGAGVGGA